MTIPAPKPILSDFDRMFEEQFSEKPHASAPVNDALVRRALEAPYADRKQIQRPKSRAEA